MSKITDKVQPINICPQCKTKGRLEVIRVVSKRMRSILVCAACGYHVHWGHDDETVKQIIKEQMEKRDAGRD